MVKAEERHRVRLVLLVLLVLLVAFVALVSFLSFVSLFSFEGRLDDHGIQPVQAAADLVPGGQHVLDLADPGVLGGGAFKIERDGKAFAFGFQFAEERVPA